MWAQPKPIDSALPCKSSTKETMTITPAENPSVALMKRGPGFRTASPSRLPTVVDKPARVVSIKAKVTLFSMILYVGQAN